MVQNKRGRKNSTVFGTINEYMNTWYKENGEWIYIGKSKRHVSGITSDDCYNYYSMFGKELRQEKMREMPSRFWEPENESEQMTDEEIEAAQKYIEEYGIPEIDELPFN